MVGSKHAAEVRESVQLWWALPLAPRCLLQALGVGGWTSGWGTSALLPGDGEDAGGWGMEGGQGWGPRQGSWDREQPARCRLVGAGGQVLVRTAPWQALGECCGPGVTKSEAAGLPLPAARKQGSVLGRDLVGQCLPMQALVSMAVPGCAQEGRHCETLKWAGGSQAAAGRKGSTSVEAEWRGVCPSEV